MSLAPYIRLLARGPGRSRALTQTEAREAMALVLSGDAAPEAIGALLMLLRLRGETAPEVAGFVEAARARLAPWRGIGAALDWPSYAAGRTRGHPYFLLAAKLVASAGHKVALHGWNSHQRGVASVRAALPTLGIDVCDTARAASQALAQARIAYVPLEAIDPVLLDLLKLRETLGLRSIVNTVLRLLDPMGAHATVQGVFHPSYRALQTDVTRHLGGLAQCVIKGGGGEFERHPSKAVTAFMVRDGQSAEHLAPPLAAETRRLHDDPAAMARPCDLWSGGAVDPFAVAIVTGTAALALATLDPSLRLDEAQSEAERLWADRQPLPAAA